MLRLPRFRGAGSFNPRNDGPLITGRSSETGAAARAAVVFCGTEAGAVGTGIAEVGIAEVDVTEADVGELGLAVLRVGAAVTASCAGNSVAPHMPQKRFVPGFSLPHRTQRTHPPRLYSLRYLGRSMQEERKGSIRKMTSHRQLNKKPPKTEQFQMADFRLLILRSRRTKQSAI